MFTGSPDWLAGAATFTMARHPKHAAGNGKGAAPQCRNTCNLLWFFHGKAHIDAVP
jgi:hypothetical protein